MESAQNYLFQKNSSPPPGILMVAPLDSTGSRFIIIATVPMVLTKLHSHSICSQVPVPTREVLHTVCKVSVSPTDYRTGASVFSWGEGSRFHIRFKQRELTVPYLALTQYNWHGKSCPTSGKPGLVEELLQLNYVIHALHPRRKCKKTVYQQNQLLCSAFQNRN